jgi:hypothetical protein
MNQCRKKNVKAGCAREKSSHQGKPMSSKPPMPGVGTTKDENDKEVSFALKEAF